TLISGGRMRKTILGAVGAMLLIGGCSSEQSTKESSPAPQSVSQVPTSQRSPSVTTKSKPVAEEVFVNNDSSIAVQLEQARQHYLSAGKGEELGDSLRATSQFEHAIQILDDLSYFPGVEANQDFNDLSKAIVQDYERYIRKTGVVDSASSIFALREKLALMSDQMDSSRSTSSSRRIITGTTIPLVANDLVDQQIQFFTTKGRIHMERWLNRSGKYFPMMKRIMKEEGLPEEIVYLAFVESGMQPAARSWAKAVGLWQFMRGTGVMYGLKGNFWYDERRDFEKSTRAAARFLKDLYADFDDWYLVMAAYNSGPGTVYKAMRRSGTNDFWEMRSYLPRETRNYVPSYIAVAMIGLNPEEYGFKNVSEFEPLDYHYVSINDCIDLEALAECAGTDLETLQELNPALLHRSTPPTVKTYELRVPRSTDKDLFHKKYAEIPESKKGYVLTHVVRRGETIRNLSRRYGISQQLLAESNDISTRARLKSGARLMIPVARTSGSVRHAASLASDDSEVRTQSHAGRNGGSARGDGTRIAHKVKKGDTIGQIATLYGVRAADIRNWNNLAYGRVIYAGTTLNIWVAKNDGVAKENAVATIAQQQHSSGSKEKSVAQESTEEAFHYIVKAGDSLNKIALKHGITVAQIERWNKMRSSHITPGKRLLLYPTIAQVGSTQEKSVAEAKAHLKGTSKQIIYVVRKGDTISGIAEAHDVQVAQLRAWNSLKRRSIIYAGQSLVIRKDNF
ncbi:MAG: LysM peptidoglycan-binding domain-containing protein, partial [bacterium]